MWGVKFRVKGLWYSAHETGHTEMDNLGGYSVRCPVSARAVKQGIRVDQLRVLSNR